MNELEIRALLDAGEQFLGEQKILHAAQVYRRLIQVLPACDEGYIRLASIYVELGHQKEAEHLLRTGAELCTDNATCWMKLGDILLQGGEYARAIECYAPLGSRRLSQVHFRLGIALFHLGKQGEAETEARRALAIDARLSQAHELLGEILLVTNRPGEATRELKRALRCDPYSNRGYRLLGQALLQNKNVQEAYEAFSMAVDIDPGDAASWRLGAESLLRLRRFEEAEATLNRALELEPESADLSVLLGELSLQRGDAGTALHAFNRALGLQPGHQRAMDGRLRARMGSVRASGALRGLVLALLVLGGVARAQENQSADAVLFAQGLSQFQREQFREAADAFGSIAKSYPGSPRISAALIMRGKALFWLRENMESAREVRRLLADFPESRFRSDAHYILGSIYRRIGRYDDALAEVVQAWEVIPKPEPPRLAEDIVGAVDTLAGRGGAARTRLRELIASTSSEECRAFLWLKIVENEAKAENTLAARLALDTLIRLHPALEKHPRIAAVRETITERSDVRIGALLPLLEKGDPSATREIGQQVYEGIQFAVDRYRSESQHAVSITLVTRDTERDPLTAMRGVQELASEKDLVGIIGPVFSSTAVTAAREAQILGVPLITPTANANGIASVGPFVFQANPDYETRGKAMARYAVLHAGLNRVAVLAPSDSYGKFLANAFLEEAKRLGAQVIASEWYERGASDLKAQLVSIRKAGMRAGADPLVNFGGKKKLGELMKLVGLGVRVKTLDSLLSKGALVSATALVGPNAASRLDSLGIAVTYEDLYVDSLDIPVTSIDGLYMPISSPEEIGVVSSQMVYVNIQARMLGSGEWNSLLDLDANRRYCTGVVFEADSYPEALSVTDPQWMADFRAHFGKNPSKHTLYGYDTAELLLTALRQGATTRTALARFLAGVQDFQGRHARIGFSPARVNMWLPIVQFDGKNVVRIDEIRTE